MNKKYMLSSKMTYQPQTILEELLLKYPNKPWNWYWISSNPNLTMEFIEAHPDKPWNWFNISSNIYLIMEFIEAHPDKPWNWYVSFPFD